MCSLPGFLSKLSPSICQELKSPIWSSNSALGTYSKEINAYIHTDCANVHTSSIHKAKLWREQKWPVTVNRQSKYSNPHILGNYLAMKKKKLLAMMGMNIKNMLRFL